MQKENAEKKIELKVPLMEPEVVKKIDLPSGRGGGGRGRGDVYTNFFKKPDTLKKLVGLGIDDALKLRPGNVVSKYYTGDHNRDSKGEIVDNKHSTTVQFHLKRVFYAAKVGLDVSTHYDKKTGVKYVSIYKSNEPHYGVSHVKRAGILTGLDEWAREHCRELTEGVNPILDAEAEAEAQKGIAEEEAEEKEEVESGESESGEAESGETNESENVSGGEE